MIRRKHPQSFDAHSSRCEASLLLYEGKRYTLRNFSEEGLGIWLPPPAPFGLRPGATVKADILIDHQIHPVELEVVHAYSRFLGVKIRHRSKELADVFHQLLEPTVYADSLRLHAESGREDGANGYHRLWLAGKEDTELVVWHHGASRMIASLQICWLGRWVYREQQRQVQTGYLKDESRPRHGQKARPEELVLAHPEPDSEIVAQAAQFLTSIAPPFPGYLLWQFLETGEQVNLPAEIFMSSVA